MDFTTIPEVLSSRDGEAVFTFGAFFLSLSMASIGVSGVALGDSFKRNSKMGKRVGTLISLVGIAGTAGSIWMLDTASSSHPDALPAVEAMIEQEYPSLDLDTEQVQELMGERNKVDIFLQEPESDLEVLGETFAEVDGEAVKVSLAWVVDEWQLLEGAVTDLEEYQP